MEIWHEITQEKVCGVRREDGLGKNSKELQQERDKQGFMTEAGGKRQRRKKTKRRVSQEPRDARGSVWVKCC